MVRFCTSSHPGFDMAGHDDFLERWHISSQHLAPIILLSTDWLSALGAALHQLGQIRGIRRMACEQMPNGSIIVNDLTNRRRYVIQQLHQATNDDDDEVTELRI